MINSENHAENNRQSGSVHMCFNTTAYVWKTEHAMAVARRNDPVKLRPKYC